MISHFPRVNSAQTKMIILWYLLWGLLLSSITESDRNGRSTFRTNLRVSTAKKLPTQLFNLTVVWTPPINLTKVYKYTLSIAQGSKVHQEHPPNTTNMFTIQNVHSSLSYSLDLYITYDGEDRNLDRIYYKINDTANCVDWGGDFTDSSCNLCLSGYGFLTDNKSCDDINECANSNPCEQNCINTDGGYNCSCKNGYTLNEDGYSCNDINECSTERQSGCSHHCNNTEGGYTCLCPPGYQLSEDNHTCTDIDECQEDAHNCSQMCINTNPGFYCSCYNGYMLYKDKKTCQDVNECDSGRHNCSQRCTNTLGSFNCACFKDYKVSQDGLSCIDKYACENHNCSCEEGFYPNLNQTRCLDFSDLGNVLELIDFFRKEPHCLKQKLEYSYTLSGYLVSLFNYKSSNKDSKYYNYLATLLKAMVNTRWRTINPQCNVSLPIKNDESLLRNLVEANAILLSDDLLKFDPEKVDEDNRKLISNAAGTFLYTTELLARILGCWNIENFQHKAQGYAIQSETVAIQRDSEVLLDAYIYKSNSTQGDRIYFSAATQQCLSGENINETKINVNLVSVLNSNENVIKWLPKQENIRLLSYTATLNVHTASDNTCFNSTLRPTSQVVDITFKDILTNISFDGQVYCAFLEFGEDGFPLGWSTEGLRTILLEKEIYCQSSHLTSFAVLLDVGNTKYNKSTEEALRYISYIGCCLSIISLVATIIALAFLSCKDEKNPLNFVHINLCIVLLIALLVFVAASWPARKIKILCSIVAGLLHYFFLSTFCWMLCEGIMLYLMLVRVFSKFYEKWSVFLIIGYGLPLPAVIVGAAVRYEQYGSKEKGCFLTPQYGTIWAFAGPVLGIIFVNLIFLIRGLIQVYKSGNNLGERNKVQQLRRTAKAAILLLPLMGLTWLFGFLSLESEDPALSNLSLTFNIIFILVNSLQGVLIFIFYGLLNKRMMPTIKKYLSDRRKRSIFSSSFKARSESLTIPQDQSSRKFSVNANFLSKCSPSFSCEDLSDIGRHDPATYTEYKTEETSI